MLWPYTALHIIIRIAHNTILVLNREIKEEAIKFCCLKVSLYAKVLLVCAEPENIQSCIRSSCLQKSCLRGIYREKLFRTVFHLLQFLCRAAIEVKCLLAACHKDVKDIERALASILWR